MADIRIESLYSTGGTMPLSGIDTTSLYSAWSLSDVAQLGLAATDTLTIPGNYIAGTDLILVIQEQTPGVSQKHKWQAVCTLNGGTPATYTAEYTSSGTANTETTRLFTISTTGLISTVAIAGGDSLEIAFSRIAASATEDANDIKVHSFNLRASVEPVSVVFSGRVKAIYDDVVDLFNDERAEFLTPTKVLNWINRCTEEIASRGYFKTSELINLTSGDGDIDLSTLFSDHSDILDLFWVATGERITPLSTIHEMQAWLRDYPTGTQTLAYYIASNILYLVPVPSVSATGAIKVWRSNVPAPLTGLPGNCTPPVPRDFDKLYLYWCLQRAHMRDRHNSDAAVNVALYEGIVEQQVRKLLARGETPNSQLKSYR